MENKEKKLDAVELNDEKLENVSGGEELHESDNWVGGELVLICAACRKESPMVYSYKNYCSACQKKAGF